MKTEYAVVVLQISRVVDWGMEKCEGPEKCFFGESLYTGLWWKTGNVERKRIWSENLHVLLNQCLKKHWRGVVIEKCCVLKCL